MSRKRFESMPCGVAQALEQVGDWWTLLIVRDAFFGLRRFSEFQESLGIAKNILSDRLQKLVEHGVLEPDRINWEAAKQMQATMGHGMHDEPNSLLLEPGKSGEIVWTFPKHAELQFACNVPGHYGAGMHGEIALARRSGT